MSILQGLDGCYKDIERYYEAKIKDTTQGNHMRDFGLRASSDKTHCMETITSSNHSEKRSCLCCLCDRLCKCVFVEHGRHNSDMNKHGIPAPEPSACKCTKSRLRFFNNLPSYCKSIDYGRVSAQGSGSDNCSLKQCPNLVRLP